MPSTQGPPPLPIAREDTGAIEAVCRVFQDIVSRSALSVPGVAALSRPPGLLRRRAGEAVQVVLGQGEVTLSVSLTVRHEAIIPDLVADLRRRATRAVEQGTGYRVRALNVTIENILPPEPRRQMASPSVPFPALPRFPDQEWGTSRPDGRPCN